MVKITFYKKDFVACYNGTGALLEAVQISVPVIQRELLKKQRDLIKKSKELLEDAVAIEKTKKEKIK